MQAIKEQWTPTSRRYNFADEGRPNQNRLLMSVVPFNFKAPSKGITEWTEINPAWQAASAPWAFESIPAQAEYDVRAKNDITAGQVIEWKVNGHTLAFQPHALNWTNDLDQIAQISMPQSAATFVTAGRKLGWENAYGAGIDLHWILTNIRLVKELVIESAATLPAPPQFILDGGNPVLELNFIFDVSNSLDLFVDGVEWQRSGQVSDVSTTQAIAYKNSAGVTVFSSNRPSVEDADGDGPEDEIVLTRTLKKQGNSLFISIRVPKVWLDTALYPVTIDPTLNLNISAGNDDGVSDANSDFEQTQTILKIGKRGTDNVSQAWFRFTGGAADLDGSTIDSADFIVVHDGSNGTPTTSIFMERANDPAAPTSKADHDGRTRSTASVAANTSRGEVTVTYDLTTVLQEIADNQTGMLVMQPLWDNNGSANDSFHNVAALEHASLAEAQFDIVYTVGGVTFIPRVMVY